MNSFFTAEFFKKNRDRIRAGVAHGTTIVISANGQMQRTADEPYKFIQDSNFWYLTGLNTADLVLVLSENEAYIIAPVLSMERQTFDGAINLDEIRKLSGISDIVSERDGWKRLQATIQKTHKVAVLQPNTAFLRRYRMHSLPYRRRLVDKLRRLDPVVLFEDLRPLLAHMRTTKQPSEIKAIQKAVDITTETLCSFIPSEEFQEARNEFQLEAAIGYGFRKRGADGHAFSPITGAGVHTTTLHHVDNSGPITSGDVIVLDVGASVEHYAADITRTVSQKAFTARQQSVFDAVAAVQDYALTLLEPGLLLHDYERNVAQYMGKQLIILGLMKQASDMASVRHYFPHATSHFLGLDTHDVGEYNQPIDKNMVLTCEPGIYIPEEHIGVRIEDDIIITSTGNHNLSSACPRQLVVEN